MDFNEQLKVFGADLISKLQQGIDVLSREMPLFLKEAMNYWTVLQIAYVVLSALALTIFLKLVFHFVKKGKEDEWHSDSNVIILIVTVPLSITAFFCLVTNTVGMIQLFIAPRLFLLQYLKELFK